MTPGDVYVQVMELLDAMNVKYTMHYDGGRLNGLWTRFQRGGMDKEVIIIVSDELNIYAVRSDELKNEDLELTPISISELAGEVRHAREINRAS